MKHLRLFTVSIVTPFVLAAVISATASAANPNILPTGTAVLPLTAISKSGTTTFGSGFTTLTSSASTDTESFTSDKNGSFMIKFAGSKDLLGRKCTGLSDTTEGTITLSGSLNIRYAKKGTKLVVVALFLLNEAHFSCGATLALVKGCMAGVISEPYNTPVSTLIVTLSKSGGDNEIVKVFNEADTKEENCELLASQSEGTFELSAVESKQELSGFKQNGKEVKVEVMA